MKRFHQLSALALLLLAGSASLSAQQPVTPVDHVSTLVGSASKFSLSTGNTYPAIALPWGMNFWAPQTGKMGDGWQYTYDANQIRGFKQTHQPSPWINDYGQFAIMPTVGKVDFDENRRASWFSHKAETASPYYYKVYLADYDVTTEITPTERAALFRLTFPATDSANILIDAFDHGSSITIQPEKRRIVGYTTRNSGGVPDQFKNYFVLEFDRPFTVSHVGSVDADYHFVASDDDCATADHAVAAVSFATKRGEQVGVRVASSFVSADQALENLKELGDADFDRLRQQGRDRWNDVLGRIEVNDANTDHLRTLYSNLYRCVLFPRMFFEVNAQGDTIHYSPYNGKVLPGAMFTDTGFWDTFRALMPLVDLVYPSMGRLMQEGLVNAYKESGFLPEWASPGHRDCMVGNNSASVVADAYLKGLRGYDAETLWQAVVHGANAHHPTIGSTGRMGFEYYNRLGYVPYDVKINESVARTLEYAYNDWCIYQFGKALGKSLRELRPYRERAMNYRNVFDPETRLMRGRLKDGKFQSPFTPFKWGDAFTEGNSWHWTWCVFHDPEGLIQLMGGRDGFNQMMDSVFVVPPIFDDSYYGQVIHEIREMQVMDMGNYAHGNQPIQHMVYLYAYSGQPWKTQYRVRQVMDRLYSALPDGYCGDEDNGQTSAWYVFSALGFYPVCPGSNQYVLGAPYFDQVKVHLENGNSLLIRRDNNNGPYVDQLLRDGVAYDRNYLDHEDLLQGLSLDFKMSGQPNLSRGTRPEDAPYSFSDELKERR